MKKFFSFVKAAATQLANAAGIGQAIKLLYPQSGKAIDIITKLADLANQTEGILGVYSEGKATGVDKLEASTPYAIAIIHDSELLAGRDIVDEVAFVAAAKRLYSDTVDLINSTKLKNQPKV